MARDWVREGRKEVPNWERRGEDVAVLSNDDHRPERNTATKKHLFVQESQRDETKEKGKPGVGFQVPYWG